MTQEKTFKLQLKNDQTIELKFTSIAATSDQLWQMFATTEALDIVQQIIDQATPSSVTRKVPAKSTAVKKKK